MWLSWFFHLFCVMMVVKIKQFLSYMEPGLSILKCLVRLVFLIIDEKNCPFRFWYDANAEIHGLVIAYWSLSIFYCLNYSIHIKMIEIHFGCICVAWYFHILSFVMYSIISTLSIVVNNFLVISYYYMQSKKVNFDTKERQLLISNYEWMNDWNLYVPCGNIFHGVLLML